MKYWNLYLNLRWKVNATFFSPLSLNFPKPRLFSLRIGSTYYLQAIHIYVLFNSVQLFKDYQIKISLFFKNNLRKYICHDLRSFSGLFVYYFFLLWMLLEEKVIFSQPDEVTATLKEEKICNSDKLQFCLKE